MIALLGFQEGWSWQILLKSIPFTLVAWKPKTLPGYSVAAGFINGELITYTVLLAPPHQIHCKPEIFEGLVSAEKFISENVC